MEAETYLSSGYGIRRSIEDRDSGWVPFGDLANVWMPGRLKGIQVSQANGTPFLAATQVFDCPPTPRKWLALERTSDAANRFVQQGTILVTCSGSVGRPTLAYAPHQNALISHDLLRVEPTDVRHHGWLYAYLNTPQARAMAASSQYGHIIQHLEAAHLNALPVPQVDDATAAHYTKQLRRILSLRNRAYQFSLDADACFAAAIGAIEPLAKEDGFAVRVSEISTGRRRFEAARYSPNAVSVLRRFKRWDRLGSITKRIWWMNRFKRIYGDSGIPYLSADELFTVNPKSTKRILVEPDDRHREYFVKRGWLVMACSGQVYGLNGATALVTERHENVFFSHDLIRIIPNEDEVRAGYLLVALTHRTHGRPLLIREAYGTSIPHLDPGDVASFPVVRLGASVEREIAELAERAAEDNEEADNLECGIAASASSLIGEFLRGQI